MCDTTFDNGKFFGKYRGTVIDNVDPLRTGRLMVQVPDVMNILPSSWATPCVPFAGVQSGFFAVPAIGSTVWIEFEQGDPDYPIWTGCFWQTMADVPALALSAPPALQQVLVQTVGQNMLLISDALAPTGGILLRAGNAFISLTSTGITIAGATITMTGAPVTINNGALLVS
jgi:Type VI secretion system/phage-baseplate injector OB domain